MGGEPVIVVGDRKELAYLLSPAAELEHGLMCEYLYAAFSLKSAAGPGLRADQLGVVERWRGVIFGIAGEEMLHWAIVQNLLAAVGSAPYVSRPHMPHQARGYPPGVQVRLLPFGAAALEHFVYLERPEGAEGADADGFGPAGLPLRPMGPGEIIPRGQDFATVGHLYRSIERGLADLAGRLGEDRLFIGPAFQQADGRQLPVAVPGQLLAPAPPLGLAPLRRAAGRVGRLRRRPPSVRWSGQGGGRGRRATPGSGEPDGPHRDRMRPAQPRRPCG